MQKFTVVIVIKNPKHLSGKRSPRHSIFRCVLRASERAIFPTLKEGKLFSQKDFPMRYEKSGVENVELVKGRVKMPSPVHTMRHGVPHAKIITW